MNKVILTGRPTTDAAIKMTGTGNQTMMASFSLAVDRIGKDAGADFPRCVAFGKTAEFLEKYGKKGTKLLVEGRVQTGSYDDKDGKKVYTTDIVLERVEFAESKKSDAGNTPAPEGEFMNMPDGLDEELPFN